MTAFFSRFLLLAGVLVGCGTDLNGIGADGGPTLGGGTDPCPPGLGNPNCLCASPGQTGVCWTGPASSRNQPGCHDGTSQCIANGEFATWGPCIGESLMCVGTPGGGNEDGGGIGPPGGGNEDGGGIGPPGGGNEDGGGIGPPGGGNEDGGGIGPPGGGNEDGGLGPPGGGNEPPCYGCACAHPTCQCVPGAVIGCDNDCAANLFCVVDAFQTCLPDGTWGPCHETGNPTGLTGCWHDNQNCSTCNNGSGEYIGQCAAFVTCH